MVTGFGRCAKFAAAPAQPVTPSIDAGISSLRIARLSDYFARSADASAFAAVDAVVAALKAERVVELAGADKARAAAYLITMVEGAALHLHRLQTRAVDFDPDVRDRLIAGAMLPGAWIQQAQKFRRSFREQALALFRDVDILIAPPCSTSAAAFSSNPCLSVSSIRTPPAR